MPNLISWALHLNLGWAGFGVEQFFHFWLWNSEIVPQNINTFPALPLHHISVAQPGLGQQRTNLPTPNLPFRSAFWTDLHNHGSHEWWERERQALPGVLPAWNHPGLEEKLGCSYYERFGPGVPGLMQKNIVACIFQPIRPGCFFIFHNYLIHCFLLK